MYHGDRIPGFPQHPHRGFETVTAVLEGTIDHSDSMGCAGRYGSGDLQWMTAGKGIVHGENFPLINENKPNPLRLFQIWLNLPSKNKMVPPEFVMHWAEETGVYDSKDGKASIRVWAGEFEGIKALNPPKNSWASDPNNEVSILFASIKPGGSVVVPRANDGLKINRSFYVVKGSAKVCDENVGSEVRVETRGDADAKLENVGSNILEVLMLQGRPIDEPVVSHGPFVLNTRQQIMQAFADYQRTKFGGWPWPEPAMVWPRDRGRFAKLGKGKRPVKPPKRSAETKSGVTKTGATATGTEAKTEL